MKRTAKRTSACFTFLLTSATAFWASGDHFWQCAAPATTLEPVDGGFVRLVTEESGWLTDVNAVGAPALPQKTYLFTVPAQTDVVDVTADVVWETLAESVRVEPIAEPVRAGDEAVASVPDATIYGGTEAWPKAALCRGAEGLRNGTRILPVTVTPFRWHPVSGHLEQAKSISVRVALGPAADAGKTVKTVRTSRTVKKAFALADNATA